MELVTERKQLTNDADVYEIFCQANIVAEESEENAVNGLRTFNDRNGAVRFLLQWVYDDNINRHYLKVRHLTIKTTHQQQTLHQQVLDLKQDNSNTL